MAPKGYLSLILHAHLPYVRHPEHEEFLEEDWLYEAITETYLPLLEALNRLVDEEVPCCVTISLTPPLCHMLRDPLLQDRYTRHLERTLALTRRELRRTEGDAEMHEVVQLYHERLTRAQFGWEQRWRRDVVGAFGSLQERGLVEIITCAATHGFLPLMEAYPQAVRAQLAIARADYRANFGRDPKGIWLPECAYFAGLENALAEQEIRWFVLDSHGLMFGTPRPQHAIYAPVFTPAGPAAFARDRESSRQVWSAEAGYPGDPAYRDFYRDVGFDLSQEYLQPYLGRDAQRKFTGLKYYRITGRGPSQKEAYRRVWAMAAADAHATHFMAQRAQQIGQLRQAMNFPPIVLSPFDAELFGHWWFEGVEWLELFLRKAAYDQQEFAFTTPSQYLHENQTLQMMVPSASSWGNRGYWEVWLDESNAWIYPHLHAGIRRMTEMAQHFAPVKDLPTLTERTLQQMLRELLLAQSSDWAFLMKTGTARNYATKRTKDHVLRFTRLYEQLAAGQVDELFLENCEWRDNVFPNLDWRVYA